MKVCFGSCVFEEGTHRKQDKKVYYPNKKNGQKNLLLNNLKAPGEALGPSSSAGARVCLITNAC